MLQAKNVNELIINSIRMLGVQAVNQANSGHPGIVLGAAPITFALFKDHLKFNPKNPRWFNRDRFILSAGHGSALLYSQLLHAGYQFSLKDLKAFRQLHSVTPGHPEYEIDYGVEMATGPLGQGLSSGVGFALAEKFLSAKFNQPEINLIDHYTYVLCSDGDFQEGVSQEALSLAGHWKLNKLIVLYDSNNVQLDSDTKLVFSDNTKDRILALNWNYIKVNDGNDYQAISSAISDAKRSDKPTLIEVKTIIGYGASKQNTSTVHGAPLKSDIENVKKFFNWKEPDFSIPELVIINFQQKKINEGHKLETDWNLLLTKYKQLYLEKYLTLQSALTGEMAVHNQLNLDKINWKNIINDQEKVATRVISGRILEILSEHCPTLIGGSADLAGSTKAMVYDTSFSAITPMGRHIRFGVREYSMGLIVNGLTLHQGLIAFGSTFLVFSDYMKPALRAAALMRIPALFIFSHDSIAVGEDGPTHEPIEHLTMLRTIPNFNVIRPCDTRETIGAYLIALTAQSFPNAIILTRQDLPQITGSKIESVSKGAYIISQEQDNSLELILIASGSEVHLAISVQKLLHTININARVVSMPSIFAFENQSQDYQTQILPKNIKKVAIEMGSTLGWYKYVGSDGLVIGIDKFGSSAPMADILLDNGFTSEAIFNKIKTYLKLEGENI